MKRLFLALFLLLPFNLYAAENVKIEYTTNYININPEQNFEVGIKFTIKKGWHILGQDVGDIGLPTTVDWVLPEGYEVVATKWSETKKFIDGEITQYGYENQAYYQATIKPSDYLRTKANLRAKISWLACFEDECVPGDETISWSQNISPHNQVETTDWQKFIEITHSQNLWQILFFAFFGGIILNFMPCIFPILSLKAISLIQSVQSKKNIRLESLLYLAGVVSSFLIIASTLIYLRSKGQEIGWGFQLQSPIFVTLMIIIFCFIFLMLLDIVNLKNPFANRVGRISFNKQKIDAFVTGFFAVLIASPCTAPFMGVAIGYTLSQSIYIYYPVFLALSLGYALPFTLIGFFPQTLHKIMPRPGKWMEILKKLFAAPILLTIIWLVWVLIAQLQHAQTEKKVLWQNYNEQAITQSLDNGQAVFIDFTAKWCITCLANEKLALQSNRFIKLVKTKNIALFKADWTNHDPVVTQALNQYGRNSVPLYVYYTQKGAKPILLPQLLTIKVLEKNL